MLFPIFVTFGLIINLHQSLGHQDLILGEIIIERHVTGVLGEEVNLHCLYTGKLNVSHSFWKRRDSTGQRAKLLAGYKNGKPFAKDNFSTPASITNLTVKMDINSLEAAGVYTCLFSIDDDEIMETVILSVIARPHVSTHAEEEVLNGIHYQSIFCSSSNAKPNATLHWDIHGAPPSEDIFKIHNTHSKLPNDTYSTVSMLRFPIDLNSESSVACVIQHPAFTEPSTTVINLQTFVSPNISMEVALTEKEGKAVFEVICSAKGGRPHPSITWIQPESADTSCSANFVNFELVSSSQCFPLDVYEGKNITCVFGYSLLAALEKTITLPTYYLTTLHLTNSSIRMDHLNNSNLLILKEEDGDIRVGIEVLGNVPRYEINCTKDGEPLSEYGYVDSIGLMIRGPVRANHAGIYQCQAFYYKHTASLQFEIDVKTKFREPAPIKVTLTSNTSWENGFEYSELKCMADNVSPDAKITWETGNCSNGISASKHGNVVFGSQQDNGVVWSTVWLPIYSYAGCTVICEVLYHSSLEKPVQKSIDIPLIEPPRSHVNVSLQRDSTHWTAVCKSVEAIANISWVISDTNITALPLVINKTIEGNKVLLTCIYKFNLKQHEGKFLTCVIQNVYGEIRRTIHVPHFVISSIVVCNKTIPHAKHTGLHRVAIQENVSNQRIIFRVNGNASSLSNIKCFRSNGLSAQTQGMALVFPQQVSESDAGLYTCFSSWSNHNATVTVLVEVTSQEIHSSIVMLILICFSSAVAITLILMVVLCIFCKRNKEVQCSNQDWKKRESLAALMQDQRSPEVKKAKGQGQEYAELVHYSIVIDVKSMV
ncbi:uncharacterized protein si:ch211-149e23.4 [Silurus meridionalis]|uniref:Ig-like domain-containing protein n=1 Tax=Silurus meridionalis TaxID=175797 RepID=A0A8T0B449_SILME|nr:uncharacterized protein si:ch211-149e23.4 [Silurus meridionalis]KAF7699823.1 hypothetical protein HF521_002781 [Silurus meridionalis]